MPRQPPPPLSLALQLLRSAKGWSQKELAAACGTRNSVISDLELGRRELTRDRLGEMAVTLGHPPESIDLLLLAIAGVEQEGRGIDGLTSKAALGAAVEVAGIVSRHLKSRILDAKAESARRRAGELWATLSQRPTRQREILIELADEFKSWALAERLCRESLNSAGAEPERAMELSQLALVVADSADGIDDWKDRLRGYVWAHIGNARRVAGDFPGAEIAFGTALKFWGTSDEPCILDESVLPSLRASLLKHQGRCPEALALLEEAFQKARTSEGQAKILLKRAFTLEQLSKPREALQTLEAAEELIDRLKEGARLRFALRFNQAVNLCHLQRFPEAARMLPEVSGLAFRLDKPLDILRVRWLEGRVRAGFGDLQGAAEILAEIRVSLIDRNVLYDAALVTLELAGVYLQAGRTPEVKRIARDLLPVLDAHGLKREIALALQVFLKAVREENLSLTLVREIAESIRRVACGP